MPPITVSQTITAIVDRSGSVAVPARGLTLSLVPGKDGRFRLRARVVDRMASVGIKPRDANGHHLPVGHILTQAEAERAVRTLMGLDEKAPRQRVGDVSLHASV